MVRRFTGVTVPSSLLATTAMLPVGRHRDRVRLDSCRDGRDHVAVGGVDDGQLVLPSSATRIRRPSGLRGRRVGKRPCCYPAGRRHAGVQVHGSDGRTRLRVVAEVCRRRPRVPASARAARPGIDACGARVLRRSSCSCMTDAEAIATTRHND